MARINISSVVMSVSMLVTAYAFIREIFLKRKLIDRHLYHAIGQKMSMIREMAAQNINDQPARRLLNHYYWNRLLKNSMFIGLVYFILAIFHLVPRSI